jgi:hypothetical protein
LKANFVYKLLIIIKYGKHNPEKLKITRKIAFEFLTHLELKWASDLGYTGEKSTAIFHLLFLSVTLGISVDHFFGNNSASDVFGSKIQF